MPRRLAALLAFAAALALVAGGCNKARTDAIALVNQGVRALNRGDVGTAQSHFARAAQLDEQNASAQYHLGLVELYHQDAPDKALIRFETAERLAPKDVDILFQLGRLQALEGDARKGLEVLERVIALDPNHAPSWYFKGVAYKRLDMLKEADAAWREAVAIAPNEVRAFASLADLYEEQGAEDAARAVLTEAIRHNPVNADLRNALGVLALRHGENELAIEQFNEAHLRDPTRTDVVYNAAFAYAQSGDRKKAINWLTAFLSAADPIAEKANMRVARALRDTLAQEARAAR